MRRTIAAAALVVAAAGLLAVRTADAHRTPANVVRQGTLDDATIVAIFDAANTADIETAQLAAEKATNKDVRALAQQFVHDHTAVRQQGRDLAKKLGVTPTPPADSSAAKAHAQAMAMLRSKSGADFDRAWLQHEVAYHKAVIDAVTSTLLPAIKNAELKALVVKVAPAFQAHMAAAENLEKKVASN
ncbi:MAG TPA: DUF4142 domain-containing protein [Gemmatimonadaceae bacterium]|nr:DUF4142 domain-containing protein [Gemmatimonadaceae bacterium]